MVAVARPITEKEAVFAVRNYLQENVSQKNDGKTISQITPIKKDGLFLGYAIDLKPSGFVLVPAFTELSPIKAAFPEGHFQECANHPLVHLVTNEMAKVHDVVKQFHFSQKGQTLLNRVFENQHTAWDSLLDNSKAFTSSTELYVARILRAMGSDGVLGDIRWGQQYPYCQGLDKINTKYYGTNDPNHLYQPLSAEVWPCTGCTATALAQAMRYWEYPAQCLKNENVSYTVHPTDGMLSLANPLGIHIEKTIGDVPYDWGHMKPSYTVPSTPFGQPTPTNEEKAVGNLYKDIVLALQAKIAHGAVIVNPDTNMPVAYATPAEFYTSVGFPFSALEILQPYFGYTRPSVLTPTSLSTYGSVGTPDEASATWYWVIAKQILRGYPVMLQFSGTSNGAPFDHACIVTGLYYKTGNARQLYFNFGWNGNSADSGEY